MLMRELMTTGEMSGRKDLARVIRFPSVSNPRLRCASIRYVTGKDEAKILASDGVLLGTNAEITQSFELQRQLNPRIKKPVGHIALSFKPEDKPRLTDEFMTKIALEYMQMMCITDTQFIIVRHHNTDNPHCHIVYNRINNEGKLISDRNDYRRNEQVTKALKSKYGLTYGTGDRFPR